MFIMSNQYNMLNMDDSSTYEYREYDDYDYDYGSTGSGYETPIPIRNNHNNNNEIPTLPPPQERYPPYVTVRSRARLQAQERYDSRMEDRRRRRQRSRSPSPENNQNQELERNHQELERNLFRILQDDSDTVLSDFLELHSDHNLNHFNVNIPPNNYFINNLVIVPPSPSPSPPPSPPKIIPANHPEGEDMPGKQGLTCIVCMENKIQIVAKCGHLCACIKCSKGICLHSGKCPLCRDPWNDLRKIFLPD